MSTTRSDELPAELERVRLGLATWREQRRGGGRIPKELWGEAARAARQYGLNRVSKALGLDYNHLKRRIGRRAGAVQTPEGLAPVFVELEGQRVSAGRHGPEADLTCVVEMEKGNGARMRICVRDVAGVDWGKLKEAFLGA
jgi:hypothetical protein